MSKSTKQAPSLPGAKPKKLGDKQRTQQNTKGKQNTMNATLKALFGVIHLILKVSLLIAAIAMFKMPQIDFIKMIPLFQVVGGIILLFLAYLELYGYFVKSPAKKLSDEERPSALNAFIETPVK